LPRCRAAPSPRCCRPSASPPRCSRRSEALNDAERRHDRRRCRGGSQSTFRRAGALVLNVALLLTVVVILAGGEFVFKRAGLATQGQLLGEGIWTLATLPSFYLALALYGVATLLWIYVLSRVPLTQAYPWMAGAAVLVPLIAWWFYGERLNVVFW